MKHDSDEEKVFYEGEIRTFSEACEIVIQRMIELDLRNAPEFTPESDPYKWLASNMKKNIRVLRGWAYDWNSSSGMRPTLNDFLKIIYITKSRRAIELLEEIISNATPEQKARNHGDLLKQVAAGMRELADHIESIAEKNKNV